MRRGITWYRGWSRTPVGAFLLTVAVALLTWVILTTLLGSTHASPWHPLTIGIAVGVIQAMKARGGHEPSRAQRRTGWILVAAGLALFAIVMIVSLLSS